MGRHSAPDQNGPDDDAVTLTLAPGAPAGPEADAGPPTGRHAAVDAGESPAAAGTAAADTAAAKAAAKQARRAQKTAGKQAAAAEKADRAAAKAADKAADGAAKSAADADKARARREAAERKAAADLDRKQSRTASNTRSDLRMLRRNRSLRLACLGVIVIAFGGYTAVMVALDRTDKYLLWIWIPIVLSGVLVGTCLDLAYRRAARRPAPAESGAGAADGPPGGAAVGPSSPEA